MLKKEIMDTLKQTGAILSFMLLIPVIHQVNEIRLGGTSSLGNYFIKGASLNFMLLIVGLAYMMFSSEDNDDAMEYLKSLPVSKWELLNIKILPRLAVLSVPILGFTIFSALTAPSDITDYFFLLVAPVALTVIIALISGFFLGISDRKNPILIGAMTLLSSYPIFLGSIIVHRISRYIVHQTQAEIPLYLYALVHFVTVTIPVLIPLCLLIPVYRSWDCRSGKVRSQAILKRLAVPSILIVILWGVLSP
ncbi:MAG: hypothetical protein KAR40_08430 [Candidatus Sabulitectum sp.]|nr:hypothetical protein [Candidatus Sabulitectum sp.]